MLSSSPRSLLPFLVSLVWKFILRGVFHLSQHRFYRSLLIVLLAIILFLTPIHNFNPQVALAIGNDPCATPGKDGVGSVSAIVNTYFAAAGSTLNAGIANTAITLGVQGGSSVPVAVGDLLMIIQMQDADIDSDNNDSYGDGVGGGGDESPYSPYTRSSDPPPSTGASGFTNLNNAGRYEYVTVTNVSGSGTTGDTITIKGTGTNQGLNYTYRSATATTTEGRRSYQVIRVPQYSTATLSSGTTAPAWDGSIGGVFAIDVAGTLTFGGGTVLDLWGKGFRGGAGQRLFSSGTTATTDYRTVSGTRNGSKGEGIAGTPRYTLNYFNPTTINTTTFNPSPLPTFTDNSSEGYPNGSFGRGAPGNAGGGSTDGRLQNDENSGGGGGSNGGDGGRGGRAWQSQLATGGYGGTAVSTSEPGFDSGRRLFLGGGGGAGTSNNGSYSSSRAFTVRTPSTSSTLNDYGNPGSNSDNGTNSNNFSSTYTGIQSSGGAGGGIAVIRANTLAGSGTLDLRGVLGLSVGRDGAGGGGAGGTAYISANSSTGTLTIDARGGDGGWATFQEAHGPGGGGGGGAVFRKTPITSSITSTLTGGTGGQTGLKDNTNPYNFFAAGGTGIVGEFDAADSPGIQSGDQCIPQLTVTKTTSTPPINKPATGTMTATYTITVSNAALKAPATNVVISDLLPTGFTLDTTTAPVITLSTGATRTSTVDPANGATNPSWGNFTIPEAESVTITFNVSIPNTQALGTYQNPATATYDDPQRTIANGTTTATYDSASSTGEDVTIVAPNLLLVKRITALNGSPLTGFTNDTTSPQAAEDELVNKWPTDRDIYLRGTINLTQVAPGDEVEYTVYFVNNGNRNATNINICDVVPDNMTYVPSSMVLFLDNDVSLGNPTSPDTGTYLTALGTAPNTLTDSNGDNDRGAYYPPGTAPLPTGLCKKNAITINGANNTTGAVVWKVVDNSTTPNNISYATAAGTPPNSYGFVRFRAKVK